MKKRRVIKRDDYNRKYKWKPIIQTLCKPEQGWAEMLYPPVKMVEVFANPLKKQVIIEDQDIIIDTYTTKKEFREALIDLFRWAGSDNFKGFTCFNNEETYIGFEKLDIEWLAELQIRYTR